MNHQKAFLLVLMLSISLTNIVYAGNNDATDYSVSKHWLSLPLTAKKNVDIFYLYPTAWQKTNKTDPNICNIDNPSMLKGSNMAFQKSATAFETVGNIYAPYYRQADMGYTLTLPIDKQTQFIGGIPRTDIMAAFDYYIKNYNHNRPFILASHSQGSDLMLYILSDYMKEHPNVYKRMIAAYVIGYSVTKDYLAKNLHLKYAKGPDDIGVIVSYNTEAPGVKGKNPVLLTGGISINPITWTREETLVKADKNLGSRLQSKDGKWVNIKNYADAQVNKARGVVICSTVDVNKLSPGNAVFPKGVYHPYDYPFYYYNIRENAENRVKKYFKTHKVHH